MKNGNAGRVRGMGQFGNFSAKVNQHLWPVLKSAIKEGEIDVGKMTDAEIKQCIQRGFLTSESIKKPEAPAVIIPKTGYALAEHILGRDFISPEIISKARKVSYRKEVLQHFFATFPTEETMVWLRDTDQGFALVGGTPNPMNLLEIRDLNPQLFYSEKVRWYEEDEQKFSRKDKMTTEWLMLRKGVVPGSIREKRNEQRKLLSEVEYVPNAPESVWGETTYREVRGAWLFPDIYGRTSSVDSDGDRIRVGDSANGGVSVAINWDVSHYSNLGLVSARKRNLNS